MNTQAKSPYRHFSSVYGQPNPVMAHGEGCYLTDQDGRRYLDFLSGIAVSALGHSHPKILAAIHQQVDQFLHTSNLYLSQPVLDLAALLIRHSMADKVFFCNSGTEANEGALKFARKWGKSTKGDHAFKVVTFKGGFHGRTMGSLALTAKSAYREPFQPLIPGVEFADFNQTDQIEQLIDDSTCAVFLEIIQGEGGVRPASPQFLSAIRDLCDRHQVLLIADEVQTGLGRTGSMWAYEQTPILPDLVTTAKPLGGGLPIGAVLMTDRVAEVIQAGDHGSTFGGNPVACAAGVAVMQVLTEPGFLAQVQQTGTILKDMLGQLQQQYQQITAIRGRGLMWALDLKQPVGPIVGRAKELGLLIGSAGSHTLRLLPPLITGLSELAEAGDILAHSLADVASGNCQEEVVP